MRTGYRILLSFLLILSLLTACSCSAVKETGPAANSSSAANESINMQSSSKGITIDTTKKTEKTIVDKKSCSFAIPSGNGVFTVSLPEGSAAAGKKLTVTGLQGKMENIVSPGFLLEETGKPGEHVELNTPATITYLQEEPIPEDICIVKYSEDGKSFEPVACQRIKLNGANGLYAIVDSFSPYGLGKVTKEQLKKLMENGFVWVLEASNGNGYRLTENIADAKSLDINFHIKAASTPFYGSFADNTSLFNLKLLDPDRGVHRGIFDVNVFGVSKDEKSAEIEGHKLPLAVGTQLADDNLRIRMVPEYIDMLAPLEKDDGPLAPLTKPNLIAPEVIGYRGWGVASLRLKDYVGPLMDEFKAHAGSKVMAKIPLIIRVREGVAKVYFSFGQFGRICLKGTYVGKGVKEAAAPPELKDPKKDYSPNKPANPPAPWDILKPEELLADLTQNSDGSITQTVGQGSGGFPIVFGPFDEEEEEEEEKVASLQEVLGLFEENDRMTAEAKAHSSDLPQLDDVELPDEMSEYDGEEYYDESELSPEESNAESSETDETSE